MNMPKFQIGDIVLVPKCEGVKEYATCPECSGNKFVTVIAGKNPPVTINCQLCCRTPYDESSAGVVAYYSQKASVELATIHGMEINRDGIIEYRTSRGIFKDDQVFHQANRLAAANRALQLAEEHNNSELDRVNQKVKPNKTWAWNASYHRKEIKEALRRLEHHTEALAVAARLQKKEKEAK